MKRPLFTVGIGFLTVTVVAVFLGAQWAVYLGIGMFVVGGILYFFKTPITSTISMVLLVGAVACGSFVLFYLFRYQPIVGLEGNTLQMEGFVTQVQERDDRDLLTVKGIFPQVPDAAKNIYVNLAVAKGSGAEIGQVIRSNVRLTSPYTKEPVNFYFISNQIYLYGYDMDGFEYVENSPNFKSNVLFLTMKNKLLKTSEKLYDKPISDVVNGLAIGDKTDMDSTLSQIFKKTGVSHVLVVSGMHVSIIGMFFLSLLSRMGVTRRKGALLSIIPVVCFMCLVGFTPSVIRAGIMTSLYLLSLAVQKEADSLSALGLAAVVVVLPNPFSVMNIGMQLSFAATFGIILWGERISRFLKQFLFPRKEDEKQGWLLSMMLEGLAITLSAYFFTLPIMLLSFEEFSLLSPLANFLITPLVPVLIVGSILSLFIGLVSPLFWLATAISWVVKSFCGILLVTLQLIAKIPFVTISFVDNYVVVWMVVWYVVILWIARRKSSSHLKITCGLLMVITLMVGIFTYQVAMYHAVKITAMEAALVITKNGHGVVVGKLPSEYVGTKIQQYLKSQGVQQLDLYLLDEESTDRQSGILPLLKGLPVSGLVLPEEGTAYSQLATLLGDIPLYRLGEMSITVLDNVVLDITQGKEGYYTEITVGHHHFLRYPQRHSVYEKPIQYDIITKYTPSLIWDEENQLELRQRENGVEIMPTIHQGMTVIVRGEEEKP